MNYILTFKCRIPLEKSYISKDLGVTVEDAKSRIIESLEKGWIGVGA